MGIKVKILMHYVNRICARLKYPQYQNDWILSERIRFENSWHYKAFKLTVVQEALLIRKIMQRCERNLRARLRAMKSARVFQCCRKTSFWISIIPAAASRVWTERVSATAGTKSEAASRIRAALEIGWTRCYTKVEYVYGTAQLRQSKDDVNLGDKTPPSHPKRP
ncbi:oxidoreductase [Histoplasma capsulatum var. duboisii H88]|uniref:Oxidoreductase n=1 Tax=Ajellomyces capsulatus (strain H88) TaxID=544711 RepID=F0USL7_AJEC8|nr:oxidoreductase [Histoplasma capsulatum var. duboisii H88]